MTFGASAGEDAGVCVLSADAVVESVPVDVVGRRLPKRRAQGGENMGWGPRRLPRRSTRRWRMPRSTSTRTFFLLDEREALVPQEQKTPLDRGKLSGSRLRASQSTAGQHRAVGGIDHRFAKTSSSAMKPLFLLCLSFRSRLFRCRSLHRL